jgi:hypothetical protein
MIPSHILVDERPHLIDTSNASLFSFVWASLVMEFNAVAIVPDDADKEYCLEH